MNMRDLIPWGRQGSMAPAPVGTSQPSPLMSFRREMDRLFDDFFGGSWPSLASGLTGAAAVWPSVELSETDHEVRVSAEMPGMTDKDVDLTLDNGVLVLRGERKSETEDKERGYSERYYGRFERRIGLPSNVDEQSAKAEFRDGVLTVTLAKTDKEPSGRRIPINAAETRH